MSSNIGIVAFWGRLEVVESFVATIYCYYSNLGAISVDFGIASIDKSEFCRINSVIAS